MFCVLKHLVLCGLLEGFVLGVLASKQDIGQPDCSYDYLDRCGQDLFLWHTDADNVRAPITATELEEHCERQDAAETCVRARAENCTAGLVKGTIRFFLDAIRDEFETRCDPTTAQHDAYLRIAPCLNKLSDKLRNCSIDFILSTDRAANDSIGKPLREKFERVAKMLRLSCALF
ncbi:uncharacterized protein LOC111273224 isoform X2 [Varroa jacobsoni]|uniref:Secreted protein n=1 Tax=Varroa destructor TaxID=109461 RepID=A0A7M7KIR1_VARDE|nr:uncharacterized protein LOC111252609 isoform X2 [Varroa destructor]XP_022710663.1 uncharacterized protein LOC111273224 isoform X2 [Varroa jacobsoni]